MGVVLLETIFDVFRLSFDRHPDSHADVIGNLAPIFFQAGNDLDHPLAFEHAAF